MVTPAANPPRKRRRSRRFITTRWSLVVQSAGVAGPMAARSALSDLCEAYWPPVYTFIRRHTSSDHDAEDLTQAFFIQLLDRPFLHTAEPAKGRFRSFLLGAVR
ncbi:MAG: sigma-70 family RNA polymerase sigma factor, partial [Planctomycetaceae bacterium]|nr:sigma-70 family RNA polymerase sigma factor [Planctomycetaceae bacterium]